MTVAEIESNHNAYVTCPCIHVGLFGPEENHGNIDCPQHRDSHGIRWRCNRKNCVCPASWAVHGSAKAERPITKEQSEKLLNLTHVLVPVGSGKQGHATGIEKNMSRVFF